MSNTNWHEDLIGVDAPAPTCDLCSEPATDIYWYPISKGGEPSPCCEKHYKELKEKHND